MDTQLAGSLLLVLVYAVCMHPASGDNKFHEVIHDGSLPSTNNAHEHVKRSSFRGDLGKRRDAVENGDAFSVLDKKSSFRGDLGKRSAADIASLDESDDTEENVDNRLSGYRPDLERREVDVKRFNFDLGKRFNYDLGKRFNYDLGKRFNYDLGKRFNYDLGKRFNYDQGKRFNYDLGKRSEEYKRFSSFRGDLGKREDFLTDDDVEQEKRFNYDLGKRSIQSDESGGETDVDIDSDMEIKRGSFRGDLGKRFNYDLGKRFNYDLGKRFSYDLGKRFNYDLGKRFNYDLGKRYNYDLGKRYNYDLGKRGSFRGDLGKRSSFRGDLGKREVDGIEDDTAMGGTF